MSIWRIGPASTGGPCEWSVVDANGVVMAWVPSFTVAETIVNEHNAALPINHPDPAASDDGS